MRTVTLFFIAILFQTNGTFAQSPETVAYVQEALQGLGLDPGTADGAWGPRSRKALNEYRATLNLPEEENVTGSSLYFLHRNAPAGPSLPYPGVLLEGFEERRAYLKKYPNISNRHCNNNLGLSQVTAEWEPVTRFSEDDVSFTKGYTSDGADWFSGISEGISVSSANCAAGDNLQCDILWDYIQKWPAAGALTTGVNKRPNSENFDGVAWIANTVLQPLVFATALAIETEQPPVEEVAPVVDWLYDRVNHFNFVSTKNTGVGDPASTIARNHALAAVLPSMTLGALLGDAALFERGLPQFEAAMLSQRGDGSFPTETRRGSRALHYTGLQLSYLYAMAEVAKSQEFDLYDVRWPKGESLHKGVGYALSGWSNWGKHVLKYAKVNHAAPKTATSPMATYFEGNLGWLPIYVRRFPDHPNVDRMRELVLDPVICSRRHIEQGRSDKSWCDRAGTPPLSLRAMLLDQSVKMPVFNHAMGFNAACFLSETDGLF